MHRTTHTDTATALDVVQARARGLDATLAARIVENTDTGTVTVFRIVLSDRTVVGEAFRAAKGALWEADLLPATDALRVAAEVHAVAERTFHRPYDARSADSLQSLLNRLTLDAHPSQA
jgi:hypothetical protein